MKTLTLGANSRELGVDSLDRGPGYHWDVSQYLHRFPTLQVFIDTPC